MTTPTHAPAEFTITDAARGPRADRWPTRAAAQATLDLQPAMYGPDAHTVQVCGAFRVRIKKSRSTGARAAEINGPGRRNTLLPLELLPLASGKDEWMRGIVFACSDCKAPHAAREMEGEMCPACFEKAGQENEEADAAPMLCRSCGKPCPDQSGECAKCSAQ